MLVHVFEVMKGRHIYAEQVLAGTKHGTRHGES